MSTSAAFERALLALDLDAPHRDVVELAARMAKLLKLNLVGLFALDDTLRALAGYPSARELVPAGHAWRQIDLDRIVHEQMLAADSARRLLSQLAGAVGVPSAFETVPGPLSKVLASMSCPSDILVVAEPRRASANVTRSFSLAVDAAIRSAASVLFVPRTAQLRRGPIIGITGSPDDPGVTIASAIAAAAREELVLIETSQRIGPLLRNESLIVLTRGGVAGADDVGLSLAEQRRVPVLILEPPRRSSGP